MSSIESAVRTNKGRIRANNEDNFCLLDSFAQIGDANEGCAYRKFSSGAFQVYAVCDGMGGADAGEIAAYTAVSELKKMAEANIADKKIFLEKIKSFLEETNRKCSEIKNADETAAGAGCTMSAACVVNNHIYIINSGDSRVYLWSKNKLTQLTEDDTYPRLLYRQGQIAEEEIASHPQSHVLVQYVGMPSGHKFDPYISPPLKIKKGDIYVICSDGLTDMADDGDISEILAKTGDVSNICKSLVNLALENGGNDNVTALALKCVK